MTEEETLKPQTSRKKEHGDYRAELAVEGSALPHWSVGLPLFYPMFQVEPDSLGVSPVPTTYSRVILGKRLKYKMGTVTAFTSEVVGR